jgi:hypothetical protein
MALHISKRPFIQSSLVFLVSLSLIGFVIQFQWVGYGIILLYALAAFLFQYPPRRTFIAAIVSLTLVLIATILTARYVAQNFAAYSFILLILGTLQMTVEIRSELREGRSTKP